MGKPTGNPAGRPSNETKKILAERDQTLHLGKCKDPKCAGCVEVAPVAPQPLETPAEMELRIRKEIMEQVQQQTAVPVGFDAEALTAIIATVTKALQDDKSFMRRSRQPLERKYPHNRENFDIRAEADKIAVANGHRLSEWIPAVRGVPDFYHAICMSCGAHAHYRWRGQPMNDKTQGGGEFPVIGGLAIEKTERQLMSKKKDDETRVFVERTSAVNAIKDPEQIRA